MVAIKGHNDGATSSYRLHHAGKIKNLYAVTQAEGTLNTDQNTGEKILSNVTKSEPDNQPQQTCAANYRCRQSAKAGDIENNINTDKQNRQRSNPRHQAPHHGTVNPLLKNVHPKTYENFCEQQSHDQNNHAKHKRGQKLMSFIEQTFSFAEHRRETSYGIRNDYQLINYSDDALSTRCNGFRPESILTLDGSAIDNDDAFLNNNIEITKPVTGSQNIVDTTDN